jgi:hypothetical protein
VGGAGAGGGRGGRRSRAARGQSNGGGAEADATETSPPAPTASALLGFRDWGALGPEGRGTGALAEHQQLRVDESPGEAGAFRRSHVDQDGHRKVGLYGCADEGEGKRRWGGNPVGGVGGSARGRRPKTWRRKTWRSVRKGCAIGFGGATHVSRCTRWKPEDESPDPRVFPRVFQKICKWRHRLATRELKHAFDGLSLGLYLVYVWIVY